MPGAPTTAAAVLKSKLYAVTIGVSDYADPDLRLGYAADDARGFAEVLQRQKGGLFGDVQVKTLADGAVTRTSVVEALEWLEEQVTSRDFGDRADRRPWRHRREAALLVPARRRLSATFAYERGLAGRHRAHDGRAGGQGDPVPRHLPRQRGGGAGGVAARGPVDMNSLVNEFAKTENGVVTFASSQGRETSVESAAWGHGEFTEALIEGLGEGKADLLHNGVDHGLRTRRLYRRAGEDADRRPSAPRDEPPQHHPRLRLRGREVDR